MAGRRSTSREITDRSCKSNLYSQWETVNCGAEEGLEPPGFPHHPLDIPFAPGLRPAVTSCPLLALPVHLAEGLTG